MYCPRCEKEFAGSIRLCPECFGDLEQSAGRLPSPSYQVPPPPQTYEALKQQAAPLPAQSVLPPRPVAPPAAPMAAPPGPGPGPGGARHRVTITTGSHRKKSPIPGLLVGVAVIAMFVGLGLFLTKKAGSPTSKPAAAEKQTPNPVAAQDAMNQARELYNAGEYQVAAELGKGALEVLLEDSSDSPETLAAREFVGNACYKAKRFDEAVEQYKALVEARPQDEKYRKTYETMAAELKKHNRELALGKIAEGRTQLANGSLIKAIHLGEQALALLGENGGSQSQRASAHRLMGKAYYRKGDYDDAAEHLRQALKLEPDAEAKAMLASMEAPAEPEPAPRPAAASQPPSYASSTSAPSYYTGYQAPRRPSPAPKPSYPKAQKKYYPSYSSYSSGSRPSGGSYSSLGKGNNSNYSSPPSSGSSSYSSGYSSSTYKPPSRVQDMRSSESRLGQPGY